MELLEARTLLSSFATEPPDSIASDVADRAPHARIVNGTPTTSYPSVGIVGDRGGGFCSGTLIQPRYVLTAAHCAEGLGATQGRFTVGGSTYTTSQITVHPNYNGNRVGSDAANDIALFQLANSVTSVAPSPIFRGTPAVGQMLTLVGFGAGGTGNSGHNNDFGTKRVGTTPIDQVTPKLIRWRFDNNTESNTAPGDSGGPAFVQVAGVYYVAGVTSGGDRADAGIGDNSYDTRVDAYAAWIDSITGSAPDPAPNPDPQPDPAPGPSDDHVNTPGPGATVITLGSTGSGSGTGTLETAGDRDVFQVTISQAASVTVDLRRSGGSLDTYLRLFDSTGRLIAENDDSGGSLDSRVKLNLAAGTYYVSAGSYNDAGTGAYRVDVQRSGDDHGNSLAAATPLTFGLTGLKLNGAIETAGDLDYFQFTAPWTGTMVIDLRAAASAVDTVLTAYTSRGRWIGENDDWIGTDSRLVLRVRAGQSYYLEASGYGASTGAYELAIASAVRQSKRGGESSAARPLVISLPSKSDSPPARAEHEFVPPFRRGGAGGYRA